jgi:hypothetical protein
MFKPTTMAMAGCAMLVFAVPATAQQLPVDREALAPLADPVPMSIETPVQRPQPRAHYIVSDDELIAQRGGEQLIVANQTLTAITQGNVLNGDFLAGDVNLSDSALSSFNGVGNILINTGAQVSLQTGMNLTINVGE